MCPTSRLRTSALRLALVTLVVWAAGPIPAAAQPYAIPWYTIDGGGGTSTGGVYSLDGVIGQPDAGTLAGGSYVVAGGFFSIPDAPEINVFPVVGFFGNVSIVGGMATQTFTIENLGTAGLQVSPSTGSAEFSITSLPDSVIPPGGSTTLDVTFTPVALGTRNATLSIFNDDSDENPFNISLTGFGIAVVPTVTTPTTAAITVTTATLGGNVTDDGGSAITGRGVVYSVTATNNDPQIGGMGVSPVTTSGTTGVFTVDVTGLAHSTAYSFKAYATNSVGTAYSSVGTFNTLVPSAFSALTARTLDLDSASESELSAAVPRVWYRARLFANRSYQISAWPVDHEQGVDAADLSVALFSDDAGTMPATGVSSGSGALEGTANDGGDTKPFTAIVQPPATGVYKIRVQRESGGAASHSVNLMLRETTLFSPWTSRAAGFEGFIEMHNNTNAPVSVTLRAFDSAGALQGAGLTLTIAANATEFRTATQVGVPPNVFAGIVLTHDGASGAISGNITTLSGANGLSFDSPFGPRDPNIQAKPVR